ncbi:unnamed protein product, partial [Coccothraustes coccothraustes]
PAGERGSPGAERGAGQRAGKGREAAGAERVGSSEWKGKERNGTERNGTERGDARGPPEVGGAERGRARCGRCGGRGAPGARSALRREKEDARADDALFLFFFLPSVLARGRGGGGRTFGRFKMFLRRSRCRKPQTENLLLAPVGRVSRGSGARPAPGARGCAAPGGRQGAVLRRPEPGSAPAREHPAGWARTLRVPAPVPAP